MSSSINGINSQSKQEGRVIVRARRTLGTVTNNITTRTTGVALQTLSSSSNERQEKRTHRTLFVNENPDPTAYKMVARGEGPNAPLVLVPQNRRPEDFTARISSIFPPGTDTARISSASSAFSPIAPLPLPDLNVLDNIKEPANPPKQPPNIKEENRRARERPLPIGSTGLTPRLSRVSFRNASASSSAPPVSPTGDFDEEMDLCDDDEKGDISPNSYISGFSVYKRRKTDSWHS